MVLLKAKPDMSTWKRRSLLLFSFVCHPITVLPLQTGPSMMGFDFPTCRKATGHTPKRLEQQKEGHRVHGLSDEGKRAS
jgi:hypothetical protein